MKVRLAAVGAMAGMVLSLGLVSPGLAATTGTASNAISAMHDEALAFADYTAWSVQADTVPNHEVAVLLLLVATQERGEHFFELSDVAGVIGTSRTNILTALNDEYVEATSTYPAFQTQATADGDTVTADLFVELAADEATHRVGLGQAYRAWCCRAPRPESPVAEPVTILQQPAQTSGQTLANVRMAMRGEAYASARYLLFAQQAYADSLAWLGRFFTALAAVELTEHYAALANRYGLVGPIGVNIDNAVVAEQDAVATYASISAQAATAGDSEAAALFTDIGSDESVHLALFSDALAGLG